MNRRRVSDVVCTVVALSLVSSACTRSSGDAADAIAPTAAPAPTTVAADTNSGTTPAAEPTEVSPTTSTANPDLTIASTTSTTSPVVVSTVPTAVEEVPEIGVPGLDSADAFCAAWSRFAGSFQVVAVTAAFGSGSPEQLAALEVAAAPTVGAAYDQLVDNWPAELEAEADLVAEQFLGPFARRLAAAEEALAVAAPDDAVIEAIDGAWVAGLAQRDPSTPEFVVDLPDDVWGVIDAAAQEFGDRLVPFGSDPSLVTDVQTPLTNAYLAVSCPDQGTLSGQEVDAP